MSSKTLARVIAFAALAIVLALVAGACSSSKSSHDVQAGKAHASAIASDPQVTAAENLLLANYQKEIKATPAHPVAAAKRALHDTFPAGDTAKIEQFAVSNLTVTMTHSHAARADWAHKVATFALAQGGSTASPGSAIIPGTTPQPTAPASSK
jgi:prophage DNA circulation protein